MRILFNLPEKHEADVVITFRGGGRLPLPELAPELAILKPELASDIALAMRLGDTRLERLAAVSARYWRELYALAHYVDYEPPGSAPYTAFALDPDLAVISALHLSAQHRILLELPELTAEQSALLAGSSVDVLCPNTLALDAADAAYISMRPAAARALRDVGLLGGAWFRRVGPRAQTTNPEPRFDSPAWAVFDRYTPPPVSSLPEPRQVPPLVELALSSDAVDVLREIALSPIPLRSLGELGFDEFIEALILYGFARVERDVIRATEKGLFVLAQSRRLTGPPPRLPGSVPVSGEEEEEGEEGGGEE